MEENLTKQRAQEITNEEEEEPTEVEKAIDELIIEGYEREFGSKNRHTSEKTSKEGKGKVTTLAQTLGIPKPEEKKKKGVYRSEI